MRYFYYFTGWLAFWLVHPASAQTNPPASSSSRQHFAPMEDWQLPSFVANSTRTGDRTPAASAKRTSVVAHIHLNSGDSHLPSSSPSKSDQAPAVLADKPLESSHLKESTLASASSSDLSAPAFHSTASTKGNLDHALIQAANSTAEAARNGFSAAKNAIAGRLARLTAYWAGEGDYYTGRHLSSTGIYLHGGVCAVDPSIIPYGSVVVIPGVGQFLAADTGSAVVSRTAAREAGRTLAERGALVIDIFFDHRRDGEAFAAGGPKFVPISWWTPSSTSNAAQAARSVFADENWNKIYSKQL